MRARLYRGPHDGKVLEVPSGQRVIKLKRRKRDTAADMFTPEHANQVGFIIPTVDDLYQIVTIYPDRWGDPSFYATHPDGSVYFEWTEKRGTRIKR